MNISSTFHRDDMDMVTEGVYRIDVDEYQGTPRPWLGKYVCLVIYVKQQQVSTG
jgi:hypothetical protein